MRRITLALGTLLALSAWLSLLPQISAGATAASSVSSSPATWQGTIDGVSAWITVVPQGRTGLSENRDREPWWQWGNTTTDAYLFAFERPDDVRLIVTFEEETGGLPAAKIYYN